MILGFQQVDKKMAPVKGHSLLVVPVTMVTPDDHDAVAISVVPAAMQPAIIRIKFRAGTAIVVTVAIVIIPVATDAEAKTLSACDCGRCNRDSRQRGEN